MKAFFFVALSSVSFELSVCHVFILLFFVRLSRVHSFSRSNVFVYVFYETKLMTKCFVSNRSLQQNGKYKIEERGSQEEEEVEKKQKKKNDSKRLLFWEIWLDKSGTKLDCFPVKMRKSVWNNTLKWSSLNWSTCHSELCAKSNQLESRFISTCNTDRVTRPKQLAFLCANKKQNLKLYYYSQ